ncbi:restriction endonuclease subunit S [Geobacillus sp. YF-1]|uniref:restriction endonuclease subunit S n=1 Tax=Geobacillus sp. YF-1 TaxID=3457480 RepID=UPI0040454B12
MGTYKKVKLTDIADINPKTSFENLEPSTEVSFIPMQSISEEGRIIDYQVKQFDEVKKGYTSFVENDILLAKITPCMENGKRAIATNLKNGIGFGSTEFHVIRPKESVIPKYLFYFTVDEHFSLQ